MLKRKKMQMKERINKVKAGNDTNRKQKQK